MSEAAAARLDGFLGRIESLVPPASAFAFALRIWIAMMLALYAAFGTDNRPAPSADVLHCIETGSKLLIRIGCSAASSEIMEILNLDRETPA